MKKPMRAIGVAPVMAEAIGIRPTRVSHKKLSHEG